MESTATENILLSALAMGFFIAILVALADTKLYPVALALVLLALLSELLKPQIVTTWLGLVKSASGRLGA